MSKFEAGRTAERRYSLSLRQVAKVIGSMISAHIDGPVIRDQSKMMQQLKLYSDALGPWAERLAGDMVKTIDRQNKRAWAAKSKSISAQLRNEGMSHIGAVSRKLQADQVVLIKSLPIEAGERAQRLAMEAATGGRRADEVAEELMRTEQVTSSRATLIARTEISKANSAITQARAQFIGATHYIWRTASDGDVRDSHAEVDEKVFEFSNAPTLSDGMTGHPGEFPNCRCYAEPIISD